MHITRREFCLSTATVALSLGALGASALPPFGGIAHAENVPMAELMKPDALPDLALGDAKAPVTMIEYASMTCPHCAHFDEVTFPDIKKRYIDTGKVRYILRDFPLDNLAGAAFVLAHCAAKDDPAKYYSMVDTLFSQQRQWAVEKPIPPLMAIAKQAGLSEQDFDACLKNQEAWDAMESVRQRAMKQFKVDSTPTFFINGTQVTGAVSIEEFAKQARKVWKTTFRRRCCVAQTSAPIHSPADAAQADEPSGLSPGQDYDSAKRQPTRDHGL